MFFVLMFIDIMLFILNTWFYWLKTFNQNPEIFFEGILPRNVWSWSSHLLVRLLQLQIQNALSEVPLTSLFHSNRLRGGKEVQNDQGMASQWFQNHAFVHIILQ